MRPSIVLSIGPFLGLSRIRFLFLTLSCVLLQTGALAQTQDEAPDPDTAIWTLDRLEVPPVMDGVPDEASWRTVNPLDVTMVRPVFRGLPTQRTEIRIAYDDEYFYASAIMHEEDPSLIRMNSLQRDIWQGDDAFHVHLDTFNDNENGFWFWVTPAGTKGESLVTGDSEGQRPINSSWNTFWDAVSKRTATGWSVEMRIPLRHLPFQVADEVTTMGITACRVIGRSNELLVWPDIDPRWVHHKPSRAQDVQLSIPAQSRVAHVTPYVSAGGSRTALSTTSGHETDRFQDAGFDLKMNLTRNLTLDLTANTDFAQVEADNQQINFTEFSLFFPEKRQFFLERAGIFDFTMSRGSRLFHGRRIGLDASGNPVPLIGGAKLVGRVGEWDLGAYNVQTRSSEALPAENFGVLRLRRNVFNPNSNLGLLATSRVGGGLYNAAWGIDGLFKISADDYLRLKWSQTLDQDRESLTAAQSNLLFLWQRRSLSGLRYNVQIGRIGEAWDPGVGYVGQRNVIDGTGVLVYNFLTDDHPWLRSIQPSIVVIRRHRVGGGKLERSFVGPWVEFFTKRGDYGWIEPRFYWQDQQFGFAISEDVGIPAGTYRWADLQLFYQASTGRRMRSEVIAEIGGFYDGSMKKITVGPTWNVSRFLELGGDYQFADFTFSERNLDLRTHLLRFRIRAAANIRFSASALVQYNSVAHVVEGNMRLRYNFRDGQDLWLVYNQGLNTDRLRHDGAPELPISNARTLVFKFTKTFSI